MPSFLFAYGTLLPGKAPARIAPTVRRLRLVGRGEVRGRLYDLGAYPGAVLGRVSSVIAGQIYQLPVSPEVLRRLDEYEGFDPADPQNSLFVRKRWPVTLQSARKRIMCWVYTYNRPPAVAPRLAGGDFAKMRNAGRR